MKSTLRKLIFGILIIWHFPLLIPFWLTPTRETIIADVKRWQKESQRENYPNQIQLQLLDLLINAQDFRNVYYFRLFKGNFAARFLMYILKLFYPQFPYLFLDNSSNIGPGLFIQHGFSTIIMADIGDNAWINQQVTIGYKDRTGRPHLGDNVRVTAGAKVLGNIKVGDNVVIGANAVVVKDVPPNCVVVGIPAKIIKKDGVKVDEKLS